MSRPRSRAAAGVVTLVLAAGLLIAAPRLMPQQVAGTAESDWPAPPAVGACLVMPERGTLEIVPCDRPHDAEVTRNWAATDPALDASPSSWTDSACADAAAGYVGRMGTDFDDHAGPGDSQWRPVGPAYHAFQLLAPEAERIGSRGWRACIVRPTMPARYLGTVRDAASDDLDQSAVPEAYRTCLDVRGTVQNCTIPHPTEVLALGTVILDRQPPDTDQGPLNMLDALPDAERSLTAHCLDLAARLVPALAPAPGSPRATVGLSGSTDSFGFPDRPSGGLALVGGFDDGGGTSRVLAIGDVNGFVSLTAACDVTAPAGQQFTRSLLGWRGETLPLIPG